MSLAEKIEKFRLDLSPDGNSKFDEIVEDLERAACDISSVERSYFDEPANVFRLTPLKQ